MFKTIETYDKYYVIIHLDDTRQVVRRDVYYDNGFKSPKELGLIEQVESQLENGWQPRAV